MKLLRKLISSVLVVAVSSGSVRADELVDKLRQFVGELRSDYRPLLISSHQFMIGSYFRDRGIDRAVVLARIQVAIASIQQDVQQSASRLATAAVIVDDIQAGRPPSSPVIPAYRNLFFDRSRTIRLLDDLNVYLSDGNALVDVDAESCSQPTLDKVVQIFSPERFYTNNVLTTVIPRSPDFSWNMTVTFREDGTLDSVRGGAGNPGQQMPGGYSPEEHAIAWGTGAAAATAVNAVTGAALAASTVAATGVGLAVVAVAYAVMAALKHAEKVKAIQEQADLMKEADAIHASSIEFIRANNAEWIKGSCSKEKAFNADAVAALRTFLATSDGIIDQINQFVADMQIKYAILEAYIIQELKQPAPAQMIVEEVGRALDRMLQGWTTQEHAARAFWAANVGDTLLPPQTAARPLPGAVFAGALEEALDNMTIGDCRFALCYPLLGQKVPVESEDKVSLAWIYLRDRAGAKP